MADAYYLGYDLFTAILQARAGFLVRLSARAYLYTLEQVPLAAWTEGLVYYWPTEVQKAGQPPIQARLLRVKGKKADVWLLTSVLDPAQLSHRSAGQVYRWRWRNEGLFRDYKRLLGKVKLSSRTVALVHREAEASLWALQLLLARAVQAPTHQPVVVPGSPRTSASGESRRRQGRTTLSDITTVVETGIYVDDLDRAEAFYRDVLGLAVLGREAGRHVFFRVGAASVLLAFNAAATLRGDQLPAHGARGPGHFALGIPGRERAERRLRLGQ